MIAYIALGSNLGDRQSNIFAGIHMLSALGRVTASPLTVETEDEAGIGPSYLNTVIELDAETADPRTLLEECLRIEIAVGRNRTLPRNAPRVLDLDLIMAGGWRGHWEWDSPKDLRDFPRLGPRLALDLPHPMAARRDFVLGPLKALSPNQCEVLTAGGSVRS
jgi:2-amino-4-hydroxy-6-hydroxymethyldihydropteridine diphosphokinase